MRRRKSGAASTHRCTTSCSSASAITLLHARRTAEDIQRNVDTQLGWLAPYFNRETVFLEIGAGGCHLSLAMAERVKAVVAVDVSNEITSHVTPPTNFRLVISDGTSIPVPPGTIDLAFSNQLMEHLHPDDAAEQLREIFKALAPGGTYLCFTPNSMTGPHDVSRGSTPSRPVFTCTSTRSPN